MRQNLRRDDAPLVEACVNRDALAWEELVKRYSPLISASIANRLRHYGFDPSCEETEDIRQNLLSFIWTEGKLADVRNRKSIACWLAIVSGNAAMEHMRKKSAGRSPKLVPISDNTDAEASGYEKPGTAELSEAIDRAIGSLPPREELVIKLNLLDGMEYGKISEMLNIPKGTVSSYIKRAKDRLREDLKYFK